MATATLWMNDSVSLLLSLQGISMVTYKETIVIHIANNDHIMPILASSNYVVVHRDTSMAALKVVLGELCYLCFDTIMCITVSCKIHMMET